MVLPKRAVVCLGLALLVGCGARQEWHPFSVDAATRALIAVFESNHQLSAVAEPIDEGLALIPSFLVDEGSAVGLLEYEVDLQTLGLSPGSLELVPDGMALPDAPRAWTLNRESAAWDPTPPQPEVARPARLRAPEWRVCAGCQREVAPLWFACSDICSEAHAPTPPRTPQPPTAPAPPTQLGEPCPDGFIKTSTGVAALCAPPPAVACAPGLRQPLGSEQCTPIGACRTFGPIPADALVVGPTDDLAAAIAAAHEQQTIVATGHFAGIRTAKGLVLRGACDGSLVIGAGSSSLRVERGTLVVVGAELAGSVSVSAGGQVELQGVRIESDGVALEVESGASLHGSELSVLGNAHVGGHVVATRSDWSARTDDTVWVQGAGRLELTDTRCSALGAGRALVADGALSLRDVVLEGALAVNQGGSALVRDLFGTAVRLEDAGLVSASRVTLAGQEAGVEVIRSALELTDLIAVAPGRSAAVLTAISATVAVERVSARGYEGRLLFAQSSSVAAEDIAAVPKVGATSGAILNGGRVRLSRVKMGVSDGLRCSGGAQVWLEDADLDAGHQRVLGVDDCALEGRRLRLQGYLRAQSATTRVDLEDAAFVGGGELGAQIEGGAQATLRRVRVESTSQEGLRVKGPSAARAEDVEIDAVGGFGILITSDGRLDGLRVAVRGADVGLQTNRSTLRGEDFELSGCGTGLSVTEAQRELSLDRLTARGARGAGISIGGWGPSYGVAALVALDNAVGLELSPDVPRAAVEGSTRLSRNIGPLVVCSTWPCVRPGPR